MTGGEQVPFWSSFAIIARATTNAKHQREAHHMFLAVDIGNTQTTLGLFDTVASEVGAQARGTMPDAARSAAPEAERSGTTPSAVRQWRMATSRTDTSDSLHARLYSYFHMFGMRLEDVDEIAIAGVVPLLTTSWQVLARDIVHHEPLVVDARRDCGIEVAMPHPDQVGADRIANAVSARATYGAPVIVVDFGTATNIDVVDAQGRFRGGAIMPGLLLSANALFERAAKLSSVPLVAPPRALGDTTETAVQSGLIIGAAVQAEGIVRRIEAELRAEDPEMGHVTVVGTGGYSATIAEATDIFDALDPDITIRGIYEIWQHRAEKRAARRE